MKIRHIDHLNITVKDLEESIDWYRRVFGFEVVQEGVSNNVPWAIIRGGDSMLCMYHHPEMEPVDKFGDVAGQYHHISHFGFRIEDRSKWLSTMKREGLVSHYGPIEYPFSKSWYVFDPTGYEIEVSSWQNDEIRFPQFEKEAV